MVFTALSGEVSNAGVMYSTLMARKDWKFQGLTCIVRAPRSNPGSKGIENIRDASVPDPSIQLPFQIAASATVSDDTRALAAFASCFFAMSSFVVACAFVFCCTS